MESSNEQGYREIPLTKGQVAIVDEADYERIAQHKWCALYSPLTGTFYARRTQKIDGKKVTFFMHRVIMEAPDGTIVDHRNRTQTLDNRRQNLRFASFSQSMINRRQINGSLSGMHGVRYRKDRKKPWIARICHDKTVRELGSFAEREAAARAYDVEAKKVHGEFANLNYPEGAECQAA